MRDFDFFVPETLSEALRMRFDQGDDSCLIAGGTALILGLRQRLLNPRALISLARLNDLRAITYDERNGLRIGALARHADIAISPIILKNYPLLATLAGGLANPQVRNQGTIGGNLCYGDPATDPPSGLMALRASVILASPQGERALPIEDFIVDYYTTALAPSEILTEIRIPSPPAGAVGIYTRHLRTAAEHRPIANIGLVVERRQRVCAEARLVIGAATAMPTQAKRAAAFLKGRPVTREVAEEAGMLAAQEITPISDQRGDAAFRRTIVGVIVKRAVADAFELNRKEAAA